MGQPKLLLPLGDSTVLERVVSAFRSAGVGHVLVVIGPHVSELVPIARDAGAIPILLDEPTPDMRATIEAGLAWAERKWKPAPTDGWFLSPADHPTLSAGVIRQLIEEWSNHDASILVATHRAQRGHPTLIEWQHVAPIRTMPSNWGPNTYLRQQKGSLREVEIDDPGILTDLDTPEDYQALTNRLAKPFEGG